MPKERIQSWVRKAFEDEDSDLFFIVNDFLGVVILFSVVTTIAESFESLATAYSSFFTISEWIVVAIFSLEYIIYIALAKNKKKYLFSFYGIVDLLAIAPTYLLLLDLRALKVLRIVRLLRLLRLIRIVKLAKLLNKHYHKSAASLSVRLNAQIYFTSLFILIVVMGTLLYYAELGAPGSSVHNILEGMWLAFSSTTSVVFGDVAPVTVTGKILTSFTSIAGLALLGLMVVMVGKTLQQVLFGSDIQKEYKKILRHH